MGPSKMGVFNAWGLFHLAHHPPSVKQYGGLGESRGFYFPWPTDLYLA